jgi:RimJ/RimL family protein N-acetyltransferase
MTPTVYYMQKKYFRSVYNVYASIAAEGRGFVRSCAPTRHMLKQQVWDALRRNLPYYIALENDAAVGFAAVLFPLIGALAHSGTVVMGVLPEHRGKGLGTSLLSAAVSHAFADAAHLRIQLEVFSDNSAAVRLYKKLGFQVEGTARQAVLVGDTYKDAVHMAILRPGTASG